MSYAPPKTDVYGDGLVAFGGAQADAFSRGRVALPQTLFNTSFKYDANPIPMNVLNVGAGTSVKTSNVSSVTISTGGTSHLYWLFNSRPCWLFNSRPNWLFNSHLASEIRRLYR